MSKCMPSTQLCMIWTPYTSYKSWDCTFACHLYIDFQNTSGTKFELFNASHQAFYQLHMLVYLLVILLFFYLSSSSLFWFTFFRRRTMKFYWKLFFKLAYWTSTRSANAFAVAAAISTLANDNVYAVRSLFLYVRMILIAFATNW